MLTEVETTALRLNVGCGNKRFEGWVNVDLDPSADVVANVLQLPFEDGTADEVMAIHVLEHLERWQAPVALVEWLRVLKEGGQLVLELPDLVKCCHNIVAGLDDQEGINGLFGDPSTSNPLLMHRWGWTPAEVRHELRQAGFRKSKLAKPVFHGRRTHRDMRVEAWK